MSSSFPLRRRRVLQLGAASVAAAAVGSTAVPTAQAATPTVYDDASLSCELSGFGVHGSIGYLTSRGLSPVRHLRYDFATRQVTNLSYYPLTGANGKQNDGAYGVHPSPDGSVVYSAPWSGSDLYRWSTSTQAFTRVATNLGNLPYTLDVAPDGKVYVGIYDPAAGAVVREYDPGTGTVTSLGQAVPTATSLYARWLAVDATHVYVATTRDGVLVRKARSGGGWVELHRIPKPPGVTVTGYNGVALSAAKVFVLTGRDVLRMNHDGTGLEAITAPAQIDRLCYDPATAALYIADIDRAIHRLSDGSTSFVKLAQSTSSLRHAGIGLADPGRLVGCTEDGIVWDLVLATGVYQERNLAELAPQAAGGELVHSLCASASSSVAWVGGRNAVTMHNVSTGATVRYPVVGEAKAVGVCGNDLVAAIYPSTELHAIDRATGAQRTLARIQNGQYRPMDLEVDDATGRVFIATKPNKGFPDGALSVIKPAVADSLQVLDGLLPGQAIVSVDLDAGKIFIAGDRSAGEEAVPDGAPGAQIRVLDLATLQPLQTFTPLGEGTALMSIAHLDGLVYGVYKVPSGYWFAWDLAQGKRVAGSSKDADGNWVRMLPGYGEVVRHGGHVFAAVIAEAAADVHLYRLGPGLTNAVLRNENLGRSWYTYPQLGFIGSSMTAWTLSNRKLAKVDLTP
jgi:sugar lactone lactonase YvrE